MIEGEIQTGTNKIGYADLVITVILHLEQNVIDVENQGEMEATEGVEMETEEINDSDEMIEEVEVNVEVEMEIEEINDSDEMIGEEEMTLKVKVGMEIGFARVAETIISHLEQNVIDVGSRKPEAVLTQEKKVEGIIVEEIGDLKEDQEIVEKEGKIREVDLVERITVEILEGVAVQTTLEIETEDDSTHKVMNRMLHPSRGGP